MWPRCPARAGAGGSRLPARTRPGLQEIELRLAAFSDTEAALLFTTGYAANQGLLQALAGPTISCSPTSATILSIVDGIRPRVPASRVSHQDLEAVERALRAPRGARVPGDRERVWNGRRPVSWRRSLLAEAQGALVVVDEAHATGLYGTKGSGRVEELGLRDRVLATVHTGGRPSGPGAWWRARGCCATGWSTMPAPSCIPTAPLPVPHRGSSEPVSTSSSASPTGGRKCTARLRRCAASSRRPACRLWRGADRSDPRGRSGRRAGVAGTASPRRASTRGPCPSATVPDGRRACASPHATPWPTAI